MVTDILPFIICCSSTFLSFTEPEVENDIFFNLGNMNLRPLKELWINEIPEQRSQSSDPVVAIP